VNCRFEDDVHRYVAGTLEVDDVERFELHLMDCAECREAVRAGAVTRSALRGQLRPQSVRRTWTAGALAIAAGLLIVAVVARPIDSIRALGEVEPPQFTGMGIRGSDDSVAIIDRGMAAYSRRDYAAAATALAASRDTSPGTAFYLGAALIGSGRDAEALTALRRAMATPMNPYAGQARVLAAKLWLRRSRADSALALLEAVQPGSPAAVAAGALADSVRRAMK
jgi:hypothetical protein